MIDVSQVKKEKLNKKNQLLRGQKGNRMNRKDGVTKVAVDIAELLRGGLSDVVQGKGS